MLKIIAFRQNSVFKSWSTFDDDKLSLNWKNWKWDINTVKKNGIFMKSQCSYQKVSKKVRYVCIYKQMFFISNFQKRVLFVHPGIVIKISAKVPKLPEMPEITKFFTQTFRRYWAFIAIQFIRLQYHSAWELFLSSDHINW